MSSLKISLQGSKAALAGVLDEHSDLSPLSTAAGNFTINFKGIERINSCGVREWVNLLRKLSQTTFAYEECPLVIVKQLNSVPDFLGKAKVVSFYAPYYSEADDSEELKLLKPSDVVQGQPPSFKNAKGEALKFDDIPAQYFSFLVR
jgi:hypothetical protein